MERDRDSQIRERAYQIWEAGGRKPGTHDRDWLEAEREWAGARAPAKAADAPARARPGKAAGEGVPKAAARKPARTAESSRRAKPKGRDGLETNPS